MDGKDIGGIHLLEQFSSTIGGLCHKGDLEGLQVKVAPPVAMALRDCRE
jgi:hypothetical protein